MLVGQLCVSPEAYAHGVSFSEALVVWLRVAILSFGGPAGQIAVMHRIIVEEKRWISEGRFLHALNYCMLLPGPEAMQLATYAGWLLHGVRGGLVAGLLAASLGLSRMFDDDLEQLEAGMTLYDAFYRWCRDASGETHNWPTNKAKS